MKRSCVIGIDVGGLRKGFHAATLEIGSGQIAEPLHALTPETLVQQIIELKIDPQIIAINCPRFCRFEGERTRLGERQLHRRGIRVQWTRRATHEPPEWMENGERLWRTLKDSFPDAHLIECFPAVASRYLSGSTISLPITLLGHHAARREWKDLVDACICADVARKLLIGTAEFCGHDIDTGEEDEVGRIYF